MKNNEKRRQRERQELRLRMLDVARELFLAGGEEAVTLRQVAEKIEYSATTIYLHFANKELLIRELCQSDFEAFSRNLKQAERIPDPVSRLRKIAHAYIDFGLQYPRHYRAMFMSVRALEPILRADTMDVARNPAMPPAGSTSGGPDFHPPALQSGPYDFLYGAVFKAMAAGCFRPQHRDVHLIAQVIWSGLHGVVSLHLVRAGLSVTKWCDAQATAQTLMEALLRGMLNEWPDDR